MEQQVNTKQDITYAQNIQVKLKTQYCSNYNILQKLEMNKINDDKKRSGKKLIKNKIENKIKNKNY